MKESEAIQMIAIKDMEMPSSCYDCPFVKNERTNDYGSFCECGLLDDYKTINLLEHSKHPNCPLVEIGICKNCEHWDKSEEHCSRLSSDNGWFEDEYYRVCTESDFYCKYFEKRGNESERKDN